MQDLRIRQLYQLGLSWGPFGLVRSRAEQTEVTTCSRGPTRAGVFFESLLWDLVSMESAFIPSQDTVANDLTTSHWARPFQVSTILKNPQRGPSEPSGVKQRWPTECKTLTCPDLSQIMYFCRARPFVGLWLYFSKIDLDKFDRPYWKFGTVCEESCLDNLQFSPC